MGNQGHGKEGCAWFMNGSQRRAWDDQGSAFVDESADLATGNSAAKGEDPVPEH